MSIALRQGDMKTATIALLVLAAAAAPLHAASAQMHVSVEVIARTILSVDSQPASIDVTPADIARGFVQVPSAIAFRVHSNARNGYTIQFQALRGPFTQAQVSWGNAVVTVGSESSWLAQPYQQGITTGAMDVRLSLASNAVPGRYDWPVAVGADSL